MGAWEVFSFPDARSLAEAAAQDWLAWLRRTPRVGPSSRAEQPSVAGGPPSPPPGDRTETSWAQAQIEPKPSLPMPPDHPTAPACSVALSGGRIAREFFVALSRAAFGAPGFWDGVDFFWADERCVPPDHPESNFALAHQLLLGPAGVPPGRIHRIRGELDADQAARLASAELQRVVTVGEDGLPVLDWVFLGMGEDGHVASLFPGDPAPEANELYRAVIAPKPPPRRITLSYAVLAAARQVWVLISGPGKEAALRASLTANGTTPLARVLQRRSYTRIYTDVVTPR